MSDKDRILIDRAWETSYLNWESIDMLIEQAESDEAKDKLLMIQKYKNHIEESRFGTD